MNFKEGDILLYDDFLKSIVVDKGEEITTLQVIEHSNEGLVGQEYRRSNARIQEDYRQQNDFKSKLNKLTL
jgi:hypothetical protein